MKIVIPPPLRPGDRIGVVAPAGMVREERLDRGLAYLRGRGYDPVSAPHVLDRHAYLAGSDAVRLADLNTMLNADDLAAVWFARGGYGCSRIVNEVDLAALRRRPKALIGFSDITVLHAAVFRRVGLSTFHGPHVCQLGEPGAYDETTLWAALSGSIDPLKYLIPADSVLRAGRAEGRLIGGCLSLLVSLVGTPDEASLDGAILFWEDVGEEPYRLDRMLAHLRNSGRLAKLQGLIVGTTAGCRAANPENDLPLTEILETHLQGTDYPVVVGFPAGHAPGAVTFPLGRLACLDTGAGTLEIQSS